MNINKANGNADSSDSECHLIPLSINNGHPPDNLLKAIAESEGKGIQKSSPLEEKKHYLCAR